MPDENLLQKLRLTYREAVGMREQFAPTPLSDNALLAVYNAGVEDAAKSAATPRGAELKQGDVVELLGKEWLVGLYETRGSAHGRAHIRLDRKFEDSLHLEIRMF